jgi:phosphate transport system permease protein
VTTAAPDPALFGRRRRRPLELVVLALLGAAALISILITVGIVVTLLGEGTEFFSEVSVWDFLTGTEWFPVNDEFGYLPLLSATMVIAGVAALVAVPIGLGSAIYLSEYAHEPVRRTVKPVLELLAGMPTVVLGFFAIDSVTPALVDIGALPEFTIFNALSAGLVVGLLITPLISSLSEDALGAVPESMREAAYGVGATKRVVALRVVLPAALSGVIASIVLALSRAIGETFVVTLAAGTQPNLSLDVREQMQTTSAYIVQVAQGEATRGSIQYQSIFAVGIALFLITLVLNLIAVRLVRRFRTVYI